MFLHGFRFKVAIFLDLLPMHISLTPNSSPFSTWPLPTIKLKGAPRSKCEMQMMRCRYGCSAVNLHMSARLEAHLLCSRGRHHSSQAFLIRVRSCVDVEGECVNG